MIKTGSFATAMTAGGGFGSLLDANAILLNSETTT